MNNGAIENRLTSAIEHGDEVIFISYSLLDRTEEKIQFALARILEKHEKEELFTPVYSCIKELIANANKANAKDILIREGAIERPDDILEVIEKVRQILNERSILEYGIKCKQYQLSTRTHMKADGKLLTIKVINNVPLHERELNRIHERIEKSSKYDSIAEIYIEDPDPYAEGMGLGLSMVVVLMKSIGVDYKNFTVTTDGKSKTFAKIIIPL